MPTSNQVSENTDRFDALVRIEIYNNAIAELADHPAVKDSDSQLSSIKIANMALDQLHIGLSIPETIENKIPKKQTAGSTPPKKHPSSSTKRCSRCKEDLLTRAFGNNRSTPDGFQRWCRTCIRAERVKTKNKSK